MALIEKSEAFAKIASALAKAQAGFTEIEKDMEATIPTRNGGSYKFEYASLASIRAATNPALTANGIALLPSAATKPAEPLTKKGERGDYQVRRVTVQVQTELIHESGEWFRTPLLELDVDADDAKAIGGATSYLRRYQVQILLGVAAEEDTDADGAGQRKENVRQAPPPRAAPQRAAPPAADRTLEPGRDPAAMTGGSEAAQPDAPTVIRTAIAKKEWQVALPALTALPPGPQKEQLKTEYHAARYGGATNGKGA